MKKLLAFLIAISFCVMSAGSVLAHEPGTHSWDRHAVWTKWFDDHGNRVSGTVAVTESANGGRNVPVQAMHKSGMEKKVKTFDFIHETQYYDYAMDRGNSA